MSEVYKDLPEVINANSKCCSLCKAPLPGGDSPWTICFDPKWVRNVWGGDSHEYRAILCQKCAEKLLVKDEIEDRELAREIVEATNNLRRLIDAVGNGRIRKQMDDYLTRVYLLAHDGNEDHLNGN